MPTVLDVRSAHRGGLGTFSQSRPFNSFPFFPTCIFLVVDSVSKSCLSSTRPKPAAAPLPSTQKRTPKKLKLEARCNAEQSIIYNKPRTRYYRRTVVIGYSISIQFSPYKILQVGIRMGLSAPVADRPYFEFRSSSERTTKRVV